MELFALPFVSILWLIFFLFTTKFQESYFLRFGINDAKTEDVMVIIAH